MSTTSDDYHAFKGILLELLRHDAEIQAAMCSLAEDNKSAVAEEIVEKLTRSDQLGNQVATEVLVLMLTHDPPHKLIDALGLDIADVSANVTNKLTADTGFAGKVGERLLETYSWGEGEELASGPEFITETLATSDNFTSRVAISLASNQEFLSRVAQQLMSNELLIVEVERILMERLRAKVTALLTTLLKPPR